MSNRNALKSRLRVELGDEAVTTYSDSLLDQVLSDAVEALGSDFPVETTSPTLAWDPAVSAWTLPADITGVPMAVSLNGTLVNLGAFRSWAGRLTVVGSTSSDTVRIDYRARRARPSDGTTDLGLKSDEDLAVIWLGAAAALEWLGQQREKAAIASDFTPSEVAAAYRARYNAWAANRFRRVQSKQLGVRENML